MPMQPLPEGAPTTLNEAFARIGACTAPTLADLQIMVFAEAAGKALYDGLAAGVANPEVQALMLANGREELAHAHRVARAIGLLTGGEPFAVPAPDENPYLATPMPSRPVSAAMLEGLAQSENAGDDLYQTWAASCANPEAAELFRQNGREERRHGERMRQAAALLG